MKKLFKKLSDHWKKSTQTYVEKEMDIYHLNSRTDDAVDRVNDAVSDSKRIIQLRENGKWPQPPNQDHKEIIQEILNGSYNELTTVYKSTKGQLKKLSPILQEITALIPAVENNLESLDSFTQKVRIIENKYLKKRLHNRKYIQKDK